MSRRGGEVPHSPLSRLYLLVTTSRTGVSTRADTPGQRAIPARTDPIRSQGQTPKSRNDPATEHRWKPGAGLSQTRPRGGVTRQQRPAGAVPPRPEAGQTTSPRSGASGDAGGSGRRGTPAVARAPQNASGTDDATRDGSAKTPEIRRVPLRQTVHVGTKVAQTSVGGFAARVAIARSHNPLYGRPPSRIGLPQQEASNHRGDHET